MDYQGAEGQSGGLSVGKRRGLSAPPSVSPVVRAFLAGSFSATCSTIFLQPLDLLKTRIQESPGRRLSMLAATRGVLARDGWAGLWRGLTPSLWRTVPGVGFYFATMHGLKATLCGGAGAPTALQSLAIGCVARITAGLLTIPVTVVKIRVESGLYNYHGTLHALRCVLRADGVAGLTNGLLPTLLRDVPFSGLYLMFYERIKQVVITGGNSRQSSGSVLHFGCGLLAGILASLVTQPADVVKTRMQLAQGRPGAAAVLVEILRTEGGRGLFSGSAPRLLRRTIMAALAWTLYEAAMKRAGIKKN